MNNKWKKNCCVVVVDNCDDVLLEEDDVVVVVVGNSRSYCWKCLFCGGDLVLHRNFGVLHRV